MSKQEVRMSDWNERFIEMARMVSTWSKDPSTQTGAVIVDRFNRIVSVGFNGFPAGVHDDERLDDRDEKYEMIVHCEINAIIFAQRDLRGCRLYTWPFMSCSRCAAVVIQAGIIACYAPVSDNPRWAESFERTRHMFKEAGVALREMPLGVTSQEACHAYAETEEVGPPGCLQPLGHEGNHGTASRVATR
jgi:dCMP deaminase